MDEPSAQLQLDLIHAVRNELAALRPLLHRLHHNTYLLQIPRPAHAIRHGSRFYYNILIDPRLYDPDGRNRKRSTAGSRSTVETVEEVEELLKSIELLAGELKKSTKSNTSAQDELDKLETLVDAAIITGPVTPASDSLLQLQPNVPIFASEDAVTRIEGLGHFRSIIAFPSFDDQDCNDWKSTAIPPLPEWIGISRLACGNEATQAPLMIAFNNHHHNRAARSRQQEVTAVQRAKRHRTFALNDNEDTAEAVLFTQHGLSDDESQLLSCADPSIHLLAASYSLPSAEIESSLSTAMDVDAEAEQSETKAVRKYHATYSVYPRKTVLVEEQGFFAWLLERARLSFRGDRRKDLSVPQLPLCNAESIDQGSERVELGQGESKMLL